MKTGVKMSRLNPASILFLIPYNSVHITPNKPNLFHTLRTKCFRQ